jgi:glutaredoxin
MDGCPHCDKLKKLLKENDIEFIELNIEEHEEYYESFSKKVDSDLLPAFIINKTAFVPDKSFKTIDDALIIIKNFIE